MVVGVQLFGLLAALVVRDVPRLCLPLVALVSSC